MRVRHGPRRTIEVHTVTDARRPMSEDIRYRERRYLISMGIRTVCFLLAIVLGVALHDTPWHWIALVAVAGAVVLPYVAVIFANGGREPDSNARFATHEADLASQKRVSSRNPEIGS